MTPSEYQEKSRQTASHPYTSGDLFKQLNQACLEIADEAGEVAGVWKKLLRSDDETLHIPRERLIEESGDVLWGIARLADALGVTMEDIMQYNLDKLAKRHGKG